MQSIVKLNRAGCRHFRSYYQQDLMLYKELVYEIRKLKSTLDNSSLDRIEAITKKIRFSEIHSLMLPDTIKEISTRRWYEMALVFKAMSMDTMKLSELSLSRIHVLRNRSSSELDLLTSASSALLHYYLVDETINMDKIQYFASLGVDNYPWLYHVLAQQDGYQKHWGIYMSYVYEVTYDLAYKDADIPCLNCVYKHELSCDKVDDRQRNNLRDLIKYGLIVWSRESVNDLRLDFFLQNAGKYFLYYMVLEADAINKELARKRGTDSLKFELEYMTNFIIDLGFKFEVNMTGNMDSELSYEVFSCCLMIIEKYRYQNFVKRKYEAFEALSKLIIKIEGFVQCKFLLMEYLADSPVNAAYINQSIVILRRYHPQLTENYLNELLRKIIIKRAETWFPTNQSRARIEITKLGHDALFHKHTLQDLVNTHQKKFAFQMIQTLCGIRTDWLIAPALKLMICSNKDAFI